MCVAESTQRWLGRVWLVDSPHNVPYGDCDDVRDGNGCGDSDSMVRYNVSNFLAHEALYQKVSMHMYEDVCMNDRRHVEREGVITFELTVKQLMSFDPDEWTESLRKEYVLVIEGFFTLPLPLFSTTYRRAIKARTKVAEALTLVVRQRREEYNQGKEKKSDMLGALLASGDHFSDDQIVDFLLALLVAGYETTSTIMTLAVKFLTETPLALAQLKQPHHPVCVHDHRHSTVCGVLPLEPLKAWVFQTFTVNRKEGGLGGFGGQIEMVIYPRRKGPCHRASASASASASSAALCRKYFLCLQNLFCRGLISLDLSVPCSCLGIREEHDQIRARSDPGAPLEWTDYKSMVFTQHVVNETLRVANIIGGIFRRATTDIDIKGYTIPKGWKVFASFRAVHLNPEYYKDARTFNPWRWQSNSSEAANPANVYTPFGGGPRLCPGYELARVVLSVFLHRIVTRFSWVPAEEDKLVFFPTTRTQKRYPIIVKRRNANHV
ncbi:hypothetical protein V8G54_018122 [Vigna mungo]|uniref:Cytochrome P450 90A1 n=1 Tax=Vigna mungo TaxID=3915 RepID=A0AAQ3N9I8_VIGMU